MWLKVGYLIIWMKHARPARQTLDVALQAAPTSVPAARRAVSEVAASSGASGRDLERITLAVSEAVTNAIVHAYSDCQGSVQLVAAANQGELSVLVADDGCGLGHAPRSPGLGLGMGVIEYSADELTITTRASGGTIVEMRFRLSEDSAGGAIEKAARTELGSQLRGSVASAMSAA